MAMSAGFWICAVAAQMEFLPWSIEQRHVQNEAHLIQQQLGGESVIHEIGKYHQKQK
jgi:hypothetical protein